MDLENLDALFERFNSLHVLVIGDVMADAYILGKVDRISPEAPVPILHAQSSETRLGGAANVALNLRSLGLKVSLCALVGKGETGRNLMQLAEEKGIDTSAVVVSETRTTTVKTRIIAANQHMMRLDEEDDRPTFEEEKAAILAAALGKIDEVDAIIFEDYDKGLIFKELIEHVVEKARTRKIPVTVDPKKRNFLDYKQVSLFKPNLKELREGLKIDLDPKNKEEIEAGCKRIMQELGAEGVLLTLSQYGMALQQKDGFEHVAAMKRHIADVSGAGDTVISVATACLAAGCDAETTLFLANMAGGLVCESPGVVPIQKERLLREAKGNPAD